MVTIRINEEDRTTQLSDWTLHYHPGRKRIELTCHFHSGKKYSYPLSVCHVTPTVRATGTLLIKKGQPGAKTIDHADIVGNKYALIYYPDGESCEVMSVEDAQFMSATTLKNSSIFNYFCRVAEQRVEKASQSQRPIAENILRQLDKVVAHTDSVLESYCTGKNLTRCRPENLLYPFGLNESQINAVEQAFILSGLMKVRSTLLSRHLVHKSLLLKGRRVQEKLKPSSISSLIFC